MKVAIVGSRKYRDLNEVREYVRSLPPYTMVISGGAPGVDRTAEDEADRCGLAKRSIPPEYDKFPPWKAPLERNTKIAQECDRMVAFWDGVSNGTMDAVNKAMALNRQVEVYRYGVLRMRRAP